MGGAPVAWATGRPCSEGPHGVSMELKVWVEGIQRIVCGVTEKTTCQVGTTGGSGYWTMLHSYDTLLCYIVMKSCYITLLCYIFIMNFYVTSSCYITNVLQHITPMCNLYHITLQQYVILHYIRVLYSNGHYVTFLMLHCLT